MSVPKMSASKSGQSMVTESIRSQIDENLKRAYHEVLTEEVPDRFKELLAQLRAKEAGQ